MGQLSSPVVGLPCTSGTVFLLRSDSNPILRRQALATTEASFKGMPRTQPISQARSVTWGFRRPPGGLSVQHPSWLISCPAAACLPWRGAVCLPKSSGILTPAWCWNIFNPHLGPQNLHWEAPYDRCVAYSDGQDTDLLSQCLPSSWEAVCKWPVEQTQWQQALQGRLSSDLGIVADAKGFQERS